MENENKNLSQAIVLFLGFGFESWPSRKHDLLVHEFGSDQAVLLASRVAFLLDELGKIEVDWSNQSLLSAGEMVRTEMQRRHPDLSESALHALEWNFTYEWR